MLGYYLQSPYGPAAAVPLTESVGREKGVAYLVLPLAETEKDASHRLMTGGCGGQESD